LIPPSTLTTASLGLDAAESMTGARERLSVRFPLRFLLSHEERSRPLAAFFGVLLGLALWLWIMFEDFV